MSCDGHDGWDYAAAPPTPILAAAGGTTVFAGNSDDGCGIARAVIIDHGNGYRTLYWHLSEVLVEPGPVEQGARIGIVGATGCVTGPHLHFQVQFGGRDTDPYGWCGRAGQDPRACHPAGGPSSWCWAAVPSPCALPSNAIVVEPGDPAWRTRGSGWETVAGGVGDSAIRTVSVLADDPYVPIAVWLPTRGPMIGWQCSARNWPTWKGITLRSPGRLPASRPKTDRKRPAAILRRSRVGRVESGHSVRRRQCTGKNITSTHRRRGMCFNWKIIAGLSAVGLGIWVVVPNVIGAALPLLVMLACPISMLVMMRRMGGGQCATRPVQEQAALHSEGTRLTCDEQLVELKIQLAKLQRQQQAIAREISELEATSLPAAQGLEVVLHTNNA